MRGESGAAGFRRSIRRLLGCGSIVARERKRVFGEGMHDLAVGLRTPQGNASRCVARECATSTSGRAQHARARGCVRAGAARGGGSRACNAQVRRQSLPTRAFMIPDTMLMTMDATNALPNVAMSMPTWKIPLASHAATYSMSVFTTR